MTRRGSAELALAEARAVVRSLETCERELVNVMANTSDAQIAAGVELAQKSVRRALRRARLVSKDIDLKTAEQPTLAFPADAGGAP